MKRIIRNTILIIAFALVLSACTFPSRNGVEDVNAEPAVVEAQPASSEADPEEPSTEADESNVAEPVVEEVEDPPADPEVADPEVEDLNTGEMEKILSQFVIRDEDLPHEYRLLPDSEYILPTKILINEMGEIQAKKYVLATERVNGWGIQLQREHKEDFAPYVMESRIELFETTKGATLAISPEWYSVYQGENEVTWVDGGCDIGDECLFYYTETVDPATDLVKLRYEVAFIYRNVLIWVMGRGLDVDVDPDYVLNAAQVLYEKLDEYAQK